jgi:hypothetical protein
MRGDISPERVLLNGHQRIFARGVSSGRVEWGPTGTEGSYVPFVLGLSVESRDDFTALGR